MRSISPTLGLRAQFGASVAAGAPGARSQDDRRAHAAQRRTVILAEVDGSKFKAVNNRDKNFTKGKVERRRAQLEEGVARYLAQLDTIDRQEPTEALAAKTQHLKEKLVK